MFASKRRGELPLIALCLALVVAACTDASRPALGPTSPDVQSAVLPGSVQFDQELDAALAAQARFTPELMARRGVVGTAVGLGPEGRPVVLVLVEDPSVAVPGLLGGVGARPLVTGTIRALRQVDPRARGGGKPGPVDRTARFQRPVPIGVSTGHPSITAGTIGARVVDAAGAVYALSNNHVYAASNDATVGDTVIQPGTYDGGTSPTDYIGTLSAFEPIVFGGPDNLFDAAIASTTTALLGFTTGSDGYGAPQADPVAANLNMTVQKCGRTTGCTTGNVAGINAVVNVQYEPGSVARFVNQIVITPSGFSAGGDSGSLIVVKGRGKASPDDRKPVALLFAGSFTTTIASPIGPILERFGVSIDVN